MCKSRLTAFLRCLLGQVTAAAMMNWPQAMLNASVLLKIASIDLLTCQLRLPLEKVVTFLLTSFNPTWILTQDVPSCASRIFLPGTVSHYVPLTPRTARCSTGAWRTKQQSDSQMHSVAVRTSGFKLLRTNEWTDPNPRCINPKYKETVCIYIFSLYNINNK